MKKIFVDSWLLAEYPDEGYNCWDFIRAVWLRTFDEDVGDRTPDTVRAYRDAVKNGEKLFCELRSPENPCFILFESPTSRAVPHIGIYYNKKVLHYKSEGPRYEPVEQAKGTLKSVRYFAWRKS